MLPCERVDADTVLEPGELIEAIEVPAPAPRSAYLKVRERASYEYALVSVAATVELDDGGAIAAARIALGSVALRPWRLDDAERALVGLRPDDAAVGEVFERALAGARAFGDSSTRPSWPSAPPAGRCGWPRGRPGEHQQPGAGPIAAPPGRPAEGHRRGSLHGRQPPRGMLYGVFVGAPVAAGRLRDIDVAEAEALSGVARVLTHRDLPRLAAPPMPPASSTRIPLQDDEIRHQGEPVALVLADTLEDAEHAATLVKLDVAEAGSSRTRAATAPIRRSQGERLPVLGRRFRARRRRRRLAGAEFSQRETYVQPSRHHNPMEPSATLAAWDGDTLT